MSRRTITSSGNKAPDRRPLGTLISSEDSSVSLSAFSFLFSEMCTRAYTHPTKAQNVEEVEARLTALGAHAGTRLTMLSSQRDATDMQRRPLTVDAVLKLLQDKMWSRWFGKPAGEIQQESGSDRYFLFDSDPVVLRYVNPSPDYVDSEGRWSVNYASFMGGIVQGGLQAMGFEAEVVTYHQPEDNKPHQSVFVIGFARHVWDRERRLRL